MPVKSGSGKFKCIFLVERKEDNYWGENVELVGGVHVSHKLQP